MRSGFLKAVIIIGFIVLSAFILEPTYRWYYQLDDKDKSYSSVSKQEINKLTEEIELKIQTLRKAVGKQANYRAALNEREIDNKNYSLDIDPRSKNYHLRLDYKEFETIVKKQNKSFSDFSNLEKSYKDAKAMLHKLKKIKQYKNMKKQVIKLGLDLAGGVHFVLGIDEEKLKDNIQQVYQSRMNKEKIKARIKKEHPEYNETLLAKETEKEIERLKSEMKAKFDKEKDEGIDRALLKIRSRIDQFGVAEPIIRKGPQNTIVVELPGEKNKSNAKEIITRVGRLTLQLVNAEFLKSVPINKKNAGGLIVDREYITELKTSGKLPAGTRLYWLQKTNKFGVNVNIGALPLYTKVELGGERIADAQEEYGQNGSVQISFSLDAEGAETFAKITKANVGKRLAIVLDGKIQSAPNIQGEIAGGRAQITGNFSINEAKTLAKILRAGSLPIPLKIEEERVVGPSLGAVQVQQGIKSTLIALAALFIFLIIYYRWSGLNINLAQILNLYFIFAVMAQLGATFTLPGIAGIVLTIGMSVDANVIINERIKEELREGRGIESALVHGYQSAFRTIMDSNLTTLFAAIILALIGSGPIKGFGITLIIGLITNLFTAIFVTHFVYDLFVYKFRVKNLSIGGTGK